MSNPHETIIAAKREIIDNAKQAAGSRFISVKFTKRDGTTRQLTFNPRDIADIKGTAKNVPTISYRVRDVSIGQWRSFNLDRVQSIKVNGTEYTF